MRSRGPDGLPASGSNAALPKTGCRRSSTTICRSVRSC
jgi:hypothetical protein